MRTFRRVACLLLLSVAIGATAEANRKLPDWVNEAAELPPPPRRKGEQPTYEVVWDEAWYNVLSNGKVERKGRYAIRINDLSDRWLAKASVYYRPTSDTRPSIKAWSLSSDGKVHSYSKKDEKVIRASNILESEGLTISINGWDETRTGSIFAYEYEYTESSIFTQYSWRFQSYAPVTLSRLTISAPDDWTIKDTFVGGTPQKTKVGAAYRWEERNLLSKKWEPDSPSSASKLQHMRVDIVPPENYKRKNSHLKIDTWEDLAVFFAEVADPMASPTPEIEQKALELTKDAKTDWEKIQALGEFAKQINYESVSLDLGNGGGYTPRRASETFRLGWGDCKDKSTILRTMLKCVGIDSFVVMLNATDNDSVDASYPSPSYFDHCITAVQVDESIDTPAVYEDDTFGRLLFIDPTWNNSPIGEIPFEAQGGLAVLGTRLPRPLVQLPISNPEQNKTERSIVAELLGNGNILGRIETTRHGQTAVRERKRISSLNRKEYIEDLSSRFASGGNPSPQIALLQEADNHLGDRTYQTTTEFAFNHYARQMRNVLMVFKPAILGRMVDHPYSEDGRTQPVRLRSRMLDETAKIFIPQEYAPDDFVPEVKIETDFGSYRASTVFDEAEGHFLHTRTFIQKDVIIPEDRYPELQEFYASVIEAEQRPIVLARK